MLAAVFNKVWQLPRPDRRVRHVIDPDLEARADQRRQALERQQAFHRLRRETAVRLRALRAVLSARPNFAGALLG